MYKIKFTQSYRKNYKAIIKRGLDTASLDKVVYRLENGIPLEAAGKDHALKVRVQWVARVSCKIWLAPCVHYIGKYVTLALIGTRSHSDIFG